MQSIAHVDEKTRRLPPELCGIVERSVLEDALTITTGRMALPLPSEAPGFPVNLGKPWPGAVDEHGVRVYLELSALGKPTATLTSPAGTEWAIPVDREAGWYETQLFAGELAGGHWFLSVYDETQAQLLEARLLVSNDVDSQQAR